MISVEGVVCPTCGPIVITYDLEETIELPPTGGVCPTCGAMLRWSAERMCLNRFEPQGLKPTEFPMAEVKIIPKEKP